MTFARKKGWLLCIVACALVLLAALPGPSAGSEAAGGFFPRYEEGIWEDKDWTNSMIPYTQDCIADGNAAAAIATAIFQNLPLYQSYAGFVAFSVFYDTQDAFYVVSFCNPQWLGGVNIALQKADAKVLRIWIDE